MTRAKWPAASDGCVLFREYADAAMLKDSGTWEWSPPSLA
jgi:hypothetical protein